MFSKPVIGETLGLYLAVSEAAVSAILVRKEENVEFLVFYVILSLLDPEMSYPDTEKLVLALVVVTWKLRPYFQSYIILVHTKPPLRKIMQNPECSGRLAKSSIKLTEFDIEYKPHTATKGQVVADFILEFTILDIFLNWEGPADT